MVINRNDVPAGYQHPSYALSMATYGEPFRLPRSGGWLLKRPISTTVYHDAMGCYPIFSCLDWQQLSSDLVDLDQSIVALSLVADPFGNHDEALLRRCFPDLMRPWKAHFVVDLTDSPLDVISKHHRRNVKKAQGLVEVEVCKWPLQHLDDWTVLYQELISRYQIDGISAFSRSAFAQQLQTPGIVLLRATRSGQTVGMILWYVQHRVAYYHLAAYAPQGYQANASYALFWSSIEHFLAVGGVDWLSLGAGAGIDPLANDGLTRFKKGWATGTRAAYLCGRIFQPQIYRQLSDSRGISSESAYFPRYRQGEFS